MRISIVLAALAASGSMAVAGPTWSPGNTFSGDGDMRSIARAGRENVQDLTYLPGGFGSYSSLATVSGGWASNDLDWDANGAHSDFAVSSASGIAGAEYINATALRFTALTSGDFRADIEWDWQGSGQNEVEIVFRFTDRTTGVVDLIIDAASSGQRSISYTGTFVAGHGYDLVYISTVQGSNLAGSGTGSGDITLNTVPLPSGAALAGLGLLGLGVRRRRVSL